MIQIGIIGFGTITKQLLSLLSKEEVNVGSILVRNKEKAEMNSDISLPFTDDPDQFFSNNFDYVVEAAGHEAVKQYSSRIVKNSNVIIVSVGSLADPEFLNDLQDKAAANKKQIIVPSAAIGGLDRVAAGAMGDISQVKLITKKPPKAWYGTIIEKEYDLPSITEPLLVFSGIARESAVKFPENVNVSAALSLAGIGFEKTEVDVYVDPSIDQNIHEIYIEGLFGSTKIEVQNTPSPHNPKTGYIVAMSIAKVLHGYTKPLVMGI
ncbi:aspartate dehydrogenase [Bacillus sp. FJAT-44742]|uniref:aspartate dehydrogenase n=1 Tax=Bacillus sp. FJAT-44742 TaxID=2014005 RepID=UPI000C238292|nr:aspartate dehydrogenase [Bacillus sp. FJAT-44742]